MSSKSRQNSRRRRALARQRKSVPTQRLGPDPLVRGAQRDAARAWMIPILLIAAALAHGGFALGIGVISEAFAIGDKKVEDETLIVEIVEVSEPEPEPEPVPEPEPEPEPEPVLEPVIEKPPEPEPVPEPPKIKAKAKPKPKAEPPPEEPVEPAKPPPRKIVGLDLGSTVEGGAGPSFGTGNALDGATARKAADPKEVKPNPGSSTKPEKADTGPNRVASILPRTNQKLVKPKRKKRVKPDYPPTLRAQGIEANVVVQVEIDAEGKVKSVEIISPAPEAEFNEAAKAAALKETFQPASQNGKAIPFRLSFTYRYRINDQ